MSDPEITTKDLHELLEIFGKKAYLAGTSEEGTLEHSILEKCESLFKLDYSLIKLDNTNAAICPRYPEQIFIPESEHGYQMSNTMTATITAELKSEDPKQSCEENVASQNHQKDSGTFDIGLASTEDRNGSRSIFQSFVTFADQIDSHDLTPTSTPIATLINAQATNGGSSTFQTNSQQQELQSQQQQQQQQQTIYEALFDVGKVRELVPMARYARCRQRFVVPVMLYRGKFICRSATISRTPEMYGRKVVDCAFGYLNGTLASMADFAGSNSNGNGHANDHGNGNGSSHDDNDDCADDDADTHMAEIHKNSSLPTFSNDEVIKNDIKLLKALNVSTIVDLMVEKRKTKYFFSVSSSEKADESQRYKDFTILCLPYPGCEFFKAFRDNNYVSQNLFYDWSQAFIDTRLSIPVTGPAEELDIWWADYEKWDLVTLTQNYLKAALKYIQDESGGMLVHCISGWDRTPLFISLIRLSLWADGLIHQSLSPLQMAYFTLAYDWYLFGHRLPERLSVGEDILIFCFHFIKYIWDDDFRVVDIVPRRRTKTSSSSSSGVVVIKPDIEDEPRDEFLIDLDSNDSISTSSNCDMPITDGFYMCSTVGNPPPSSSPAPMTITAAMAANATTNSSTAAGLMSSSCVSITNNVQPPQTGRSPNVKRSRTSPIAVPSSNSSAARQRLDSVTSYNSWQMVNDAGSVDSMGNGTMMQRMNTEKNNAKGANVTCGSTNSNSSNTSGEGTCPLPAPESLRLPFTLRRQRLNDLRNCVIPAYSRMIGLRFKEGSGNLATIINSITEQLW